MVNEFTEEWFAAYKARRAQQQPEQEGAAMDSTKVSSNPWGSPEERMNKTEARFVSYRLEPMKHAGEIIKWEFEPFRLRAMENKFYKPDFGIWCRDGSIEIIEIKAYNLHRSSLDRFQSCREKYGTPYFRFEIWQWKDGVWTQILI